VTKQEIIEAQLEAIQIFEANNTMMTVKECADFLGCSEDTVRRSIKSETILAYNIGGWRIPKLQFHKELIERSIHSTSLKAS